MNSSVWKTIDIVAFVLVIVGALNWGLVGLFDFNLVAALFGEMTALSRIIYTLVGIAAVYEIVAAPTMRRRWAAPAHTTDVVREREHTHV